MINKEEYFNQVKDILKSNENVSLRDFEKLYRFSLEKVNSDEIDRTLFCDLIVKKLFDSSLYTSIVVPWNFLDTPVGRTLIKVKFGDENSDIFFVTEVTKMLNKKQQYISREIKEGKLKAYKRNGKVVIYRKDLSEYISKKGFEIKEYEQMEEKVVNVGFERTDKYGEE